MKQAATLSIDQKVGFGQQNERVLEWVLKNIRSLWLACLCL